MIPGLGTPSVRASSFQHRPRRKSLSALNFAVKTLLDHHSPACLWRHPIQAGRVIIAVLGNFLMRLEQKLVPGGKRECTVCGWQGRHFRTFISADEVIVRCI